MNKATTKFTQEQNAKGASAVLGTIPRPDGMSEGLSGGCVTCRKEATAAPDYPMSRCAKCKLVRYCSHACQKEDWARHKTICSKVQSVNRSET
ncbi:hypothetical protein DFH06DRAFT_1230302 [Mycena polygramma]|nr:hypothetical protein DFH06DRAFT_1230302 [Mycena polygramma]